MYKAVTLSAVLLLTVFPCAVARAEPLGTPPAAAKRGELPASVTDFLKGNWSGSGAFATGRPVTSTLDFAPVAQDVALELHYAEASPDTFVYSALLSVDTVNPGLVLLLAGNNSGGARLFRSKGWDADTLTFVATPDLRAWFGFERVTFTRHDDRHMTVTYEISRDGQTWKLGDRQDFQRDG